MQIRESFPLLPLLCDKVAPNNHFNFGHDSVGQEFRERSSGQCLLWVSPVFTVRCRLGLQSSLSPDWPGCPGWVTHMAAVDGGC